MKSSEYQSLSLRTVPAEHAYWSPGFEGDREAARTRLVTNCALGMAGEAAEIREECTSDEIGDGYWYSYALFFALGVESYEPRSVEGDAPWAAAFSAAGKACELVKKHVFHGRDFDVVREPLVAAVQQYVDALASMDSQSAADTFAQNVDKLRARYPDGFFERG